MNEEDFKGKQLSLRVLEQNLETLKQQGAVRNGGRAIDIKYTRLERQTIGYMLNSFSEDELCRSWYEEEKRRLV